MKCKEEFEYHIRSLDGDYNLLMVGDVYIDVETQIEWRTWHKAWQAALASQQPADDDWIEWEGGECPVDEDTIVEMKWKYGDVLTDRAGIYQWSYYQYGDRIIAYRVVKP